jgi:CRP-like cAMP-binding protein
VNWSIVRDEEDLNVQVQQTAGRIAAVTAHPIAELLECPPDTSSLLNGATECITLQPGDSVFHQGDTCLGLYVVVSGELQRKTDRLSMRVTLGTAKSGDLLELAAALSRTCHTYTLTALTDATLLLLPLEALHGAFERHPPLRMRLLQELAREVSRGYITCCMTRAVPARRRREART